MSMQQWREYQQRQKVIRGYQRKYGEEGFDNIMDQMNGLRDMGVDLHRVVDEITADSSAYIAELNKEQITALQGFFGTIRG